MAISTGTPAELKISHPAHLHAPACVRLLKICHRKNRATRAFQDCLISKCGRVVGCTHVSAPGVAPDGWGAGGGTGGQLHRIRSSLKLIQRERRQEDAKVVVLAVSIKRIAKPASISALGCPAHTLPPANPTHAHTWSWEACYERDGLVWCRAQTHFWPCCWHTRNAHPALCRTPTRPLVSRQLRSPKLFLGFSPPPCRG